MDFFSGTRSIIVTLCTGAAVYFSWGNWQMQQQMPPPPQQQVLPAASAAAAGPALGNNGVAQPLAAPAAVGHQGGVAPAAVALAPLAPAPIAAAPAPIAAAPAPIAAVAAPIAAAPAPVDRHRLNIEGSALSVEGRLGNAFMLAGSETEATVMVRVRGQAPEPSQVKTARAPMRLSLVIDRSGSMKGERLRSAKDAAAMLIQELQDGDQLSIISYHSRAEVLVSPMTIDPSSRLLAIRKLDALRATGGTCISCGLQTARAQRFPGDRTRMRRHRRGGMDRDMRPSARERSFIERTILLSDGKPDPDHGERTRQEILSFTRSIGQTGATLSTVGIGLDYNELIMREVATLGQGNHHFVAQPGDLALTLNSELDSLNKISARQVVATFRLPQGTHFLQGFDREFTVDRATRTVRVILGDIPADEERTIVFKVTTSPIKAHEQTIAELTLQFEDLQTGVRDQLSGSLAMRISADPAQVSAGSDAEVSARLEQAIINDQIIKANEELRRGDIDTAQRRIQQQWERSDKANFEWGDPRLDANLKRLKTMDDSLTQVQRKPSRKSRSRGMQEAAKTNAVEAFDMGR